MQSFCTFIFGIHEPSHIRSKDLVIKNEKYLVAY